MKTAHLAAGRVAAGRLPAGRRLAALRAFPSLVLLGPVLLALGGRLPSPDAWAAEIVEVEAPSAVEGFRLADLDGDGAVDLLFLERRLFLGVPGRPGALPEQAARWRADLPPEVSFAHPLLPDGQGPALLLLGRGGATRLRLGGGEPEPLPGGETPLDWVDWRQATFADLGGADGSLLLPVPSGWRLVAPPGAAWATTDVPLPAFAELEAPGPFLEDVGVLTEALPRPWVGPAPPGSPAGTPPAVWVLAGTRLLARVGASERTQDYGFLAGTGEQRLADLDGDGAPEVIHKEGTNRESTIAVFRTPPLALGGGGLAPAPADPRPPVSVLRLTGFLLDPEFVDLDGDRRLDLVVTTIPIDAKNTLRALGGSVASSTRAFLNRERAGRGFYGASPEASVASDIDVALRYTAEGNIEVRRSFTIVAAGDFDGDGRRDLAIRTGPDVITLRRGVPEGVWEPEGRKVPIPALGKSPDIAGHPADLDGDGKDELVLIYSRPDGGRDRVFVLRP